MKNRLILPIIAMSLLATGTVANAKIVAHKGKKNVFSNSKVIKKSKKTTHVKSSTLKKKTKISLKSSNANLKISVDTIKDSYRNKFKDLQANANRKMDNIINNAKKDYDQRQKNGGSISYLYFYFKYYGTIQSLEVKTNHSFNELINSLKQVLIKHGYSTANTNEFNAAYEKAKNTRRSSLLKMIHSRF